MRFFRRAVIVGFVAAICGGSTTWGQYGMYGSPDLLPVAQAGGVQDTSSWNRAEPAGYPSTGYPELTQPSLTDRSAYYQGNPNRSLGRSGYREPAEMVGSEEPPIMPAPPTPQTWPSPVPSPMTSYATAGENGWAASKARKNLPAATDEEGCFGCGEGLCGEDIGCCEGGCFPWYASLSALVLGRSYGRRVWTSYETADETNQLTHTQFGLAWKWGGEARFGRRFCVGCVPYALEGTYWTTEAFSGFRSTSLPGGTVSTPLILSYVYFGSDPADNWFQGAAEHRLWRQDEFHNFELNLIREQLAWGYDSPWDIGWSVGVRYFRFQDYLQFGSVIDGHEWGEAGGAYEAYLSDRATNNLIGAQFGFDAAFHLAETVRVFISPKVGIYGNCMESSFLAHTGDGINGSTPFYGNYPVHTFRTGLSFLTQIDVGADWNFARNWSARIGYRVVAATGMALADDQFPQYIVDIPDIEMMQHSSSLVLHGAFLGITYNF